MGVVDIIRGWSHCQGWAVVVSGDVLMGAGGGVTSSGGVDIVRGGQWLWVVTSSWRVVMASGVGGWLGASSAKIAVSPLQMLES